MRGSRAWDPNAAAALGWPGWDKARSWLREAFGTAKPELRLEADSTGTMGMSVKFPSARTDRDISRLATEVFALPGRLSDLRKTRIVVALDEFQAIAGFNGGSVEHALRAAVQHQRSVGYVFAGSEPSLMERMLGPKRPFYKAGPVMRLEKIPPDLFSAFIESRFSKTGMKPEPGLGASIVDLAGNMPYDVQRLAHESWDDARAAGKRRIGVDDLHATLHRLLEWRPKEATFGRNRERPLEADRDGLEQEVEGHVIHAFTMRPASPSPR